MYAARHRWMIDMYLFSFRYDTLLVNWCTRKGKTRSSDRARTFEPSVTLCFWQGTHPRASRRVYWQRRASRRASRASERSVTERLPRIAQVQDLLSLLSSSLFSLSTFLFPSFRSFFPRPPPPSFARSVHATPRTTLGYNIQFIM